MFEITIKSKGISKTYKDVKVASLKEFIDIGRKQFLSRAVGKSPRAVVRWLQERLSDVNVGKGDGVFLGLCVGALVCADGVIQETTVIDLDSLIKQF